MASGRLRIAVCLSGGGTTLQNFIDLSDAGELPVDIVQVVASKPGVRGIERAHAAKLPVEVVRRRDFNETRAFSEAIFDLAESRNADLVVLAGFLQQLAIPPSWKRRVVNIHPSLLPAFGGKGMYGHHVHEAVLAYGAKVSGCTVHFADDEYDTGPIILQQVVPVEEGDTPETLAARVFEAECVAYPEALRLIAEGSLRVEGRKVFRLPPGRRNS